MHLETDYQRTDLYRFSPRSGRIGLANIPLATLWGLNSLCLNVGTARIVLDNILLAVLGWGERCRQPATRSPKFSSQHTNKTIMTGRTMLTRTA